MREFSNITCNSVLHLHSYDYLYVSFQLEESILLSERVLRLMFGREQRGGGAGGEVMFGFADSLTFLYVITIVSVVVFRLWCAM